MFNQKGGVFVRLSSKQLERLYEVRKPTTNTACGANALNVLGLDYEIIQTMGEGGRSGTSAQQAIENLKRFINKVRRGETDRVVDDDYGGKLNWVESQRFSVPISKHKKDDPSDEERRDWRGWGDKEKNKIKQWLNKNIPVGYITILGIPGHWVVVGRTAGQGNLIIIESQQGGSGGIGSRYDCGGAGVYFGEREVMEYLENTFRDQGYKNDNNLIIPNKIMFIDAAEPEYREERYVEPLRRLPRQPSTFSILGEDDEYDEDYEEGGSAAAAEEEDDEEWGSAAAAEEEDYEQDTQEYHSGDGDVTMSDVDSDEENTTGFVGSQGAVWNTQTAPAPRPFHVSTTAFPLGTTPGFGAPAPGRAFGTTNPFRAPGPAFGRTTNPFRAPGTTNPIRAPAPAPAPGRAFGTTTGFGAPAPAPRRAFGTTTNPFAPPGYYGGGISLKELMKPRTNVKPGKFALKK